MSEKWLVRQHVPNFKEANPHDVHLVDKDKIFNVSFIANWGMGLFPENHCSHFELVPHGDNGENLILVHFKNDTGKKTFYVVGYCAPESSIIASNWRYSMKSS